MSCLRCKDRKLACDGCRPRCAPCRRSHLKCEYDPSTIFFRIQNETESVKARSSQHKRQKTAAADAQRARRGTEETALSGPIVPIVEETPPSEVLPQSWSSSEHDLAFFGSSMAWGDDFVEGYPPDPSGSSQFWQGLAGAAMFPDLSINEDFQSNEPSRPIGSDLGLETRADSVVQAPSIQNIGGPETGGVLQEQPLDSIPDHLLAHHYTRNLTGRYSSKDRGWNYYTYFYNRFSNSHPFVLSALYSWTAAHLFFARSLKSLDSAVKYYQKCLNQMSYSHAIIVSPFPDGSLEINGFEEVVDLSGDDLDAIVVSLYFLASMDLLAARPRELQRLIQVTTTLISQQKDRHPQDGLSFQVCNWFCFLEARASAFGLGRCSMVIALGGEEGLLNISKHSHNFLRNEYKMLYPEHLIQRDAAHLPLNEIFLRLIAIFGRISRNFDFMDEEVVTGVRLSLDNVRAALQAIDEAASSKDRVLSTLLTTRAMFHAVEIYYSRAFVPEATLYAADVDATAIILTTDKLYTVLKVPTTDPPPTKFWPIPLVMASIEANDPIYRDWALRKIIDYELAGTLYARSVKFVQLVHQKEGASGIRMHLGEIMKGMVEEFVF